MFLSDPSALFATLATDRTDGAWSALPDAPIVDDSRATDSLLMAARRSVRHVRRGRSTSAAGARPQLLTGTTTTGRGLPG
jgi:hypothetical protein